MLRKQIIHAKRKPKIISTKIRITDKVKSAGSAINLIFKIWD